ncbi:hypothetical protein M501DRAFT_1003382 [Patellaria atrata CBS 101060]|uniref:Uncharacterized protein n=1 Tax=Patellaria atrata CBS 101060 TaxID=1346257 RepID=A0A9P4VRZ1_9PEZI|nr:hypothetical protein M501DRAFT_1003382 [Patellaria atrata CBS 101060]
MANPTAWSIDNNHGNYFRHEGDADRQIYRPIWAPRQDSSVPQNTSSSVETATPPINAYPSGGEYYSHYATQAQGHVNYPQSLQTPYSQYDSYNPSFNPRQGNNAPRQLYAGSHC